MELASKYNPADVEGKWYQYWLDNHLFSSKPDSREPYTIVIPPPNVTGVLHMGHMLNNTIQDILPCSHLQREECGSATKSGEVGNSRIEGNAAGDYAQRKA